VLEVSDEKTLEKVLRLIALSASPSEEEARTSAVLACRLIQQHKLLVVLPNGANGTNGFHSPYPRSGSAWSPPPAPSPRPPPRPAPAPKRSKPRNPKPRLIVLNYRGVCSTCKQYITRGSRAWWRPGKGVAHETCSYDSLY